MFFGEKGFWFRFSGGMMTAMFKVGGAKHGNSLSRNGGEYRRKVLEWLRKVL